MCSERERAIRSVKVRKEQYKRGICAIKQKNWHSIKEVELYLAKISECDETLRKLREN